MPFVKKNPTPFPADGILDRLKGCQLAAGRTQARVAALTSDITEARRTVAQAEERLGLQQADGADTGEALETLKRAQDRLAALELGLTSAQQKALLSQQDLHRAEQSARHEALRQRVEELHSIAARIDRTITDTLAGDVSQWLSVATEIRAFGISELDNRLASAKDLFKVRLLDGCAMPGCSTGMKPFLGEAPWSESQPTLDDVIRLLPPSREPA